MKRRHGVALAACALALAVGLVPPPVGWVERVYAGRIVPVLQPVVTGFANLFPFALYDVVVVAMVCTVAVWVTLAIARPRLHGLRLLSRVATLVASGYLVAMAAGGLAVRRSLLAETALFDDRRVTPEALRQLGERAVNELNTLHPRLDTAWPGWRELRGALAPGFARAHAAVGPDWRPALARPKRSLFNGLIRRSGLNGMLALPFAEVLVNQELLPFERPYVLAHEWAHGSGRPNESEAAFLGWLACMHGPPWARYSAWLRILRYVAPALPKEERTALAATLDAGPRRDLAAMDARIARDYRPSLRRVTNAGNALMRAASRMPPGTQNYSLVIRLILGIELDVPALPAASVPGQ